MSCGLVRHARFAERWLALRLEPNLEVLFISIPMFSRLWFPVTSCLHCVGNHAQGAVAGIVPHAVVCFLLGSHSRSTPIAPTSAVELRSGARGKGTVFCLPLPPSMDWLRERQEHSAQRCRSSAYLDSGVVGRACLRQFDPAPGERSVMWWSIWSSFRVATDPTTSVIYLRFPSPAIQRSSYLCL